MRSPLDSIGELLAGAVRRESKPPAPPWFRGSQEAWQLICKAEVPVDSRAIWLAGYRREDLVTFNERCVEHLIMKRHFRLGVPYLAFDDLAWIKRCSPRELEAYHCTADVTTMPFNEFWKAWGLSVPHPLPARWVGLRSKLSLPPAGVVPTRHAPPNPTDAFAAFLRYASLVQLAASLVDATFDLCIAGPS